MCGLRCIADTGVCPGACRLLSVTARRGFCFVCSGCSRAQLNNETTGDSVQVSTPQGLETLVLTVASSGRELLPPQTGMSAADEQAVPYGLRDGEEGQQAKAVVTEPIPENRQPRGPRLTNEKRAEFEREALKH